MRYNALRFNPNRDGHQGSQPMTRKVLEEAEQARQQRVRDLERLEKEGRHPDDEREKGDDKSFTIKEIAASLRN
jgi:hypothetical protein